MKGTDDSYFKTNLAIYDNDMLVVTGTSYYLWILDNYKDLSAEVQRLWEEEHKVAEEDCPEEESHQETLGSTRCCELEYNKVREAQCQLQSVQMLSSSSSQTQSRISTRKLPLSETN